MMEITALWRHPMKAHGREALESVTLVKGQSMPFDRMWAVAHTQTKAVSGTWARCVNFTRAAGMPQLQAISATLDETTEQLTLMHPEHPNITFHPDHDLDRFLDWLKPLCPPERPQPDQILRIDGRGFTDSDIPSVSLMNMASHAAVEDAAETEFGTERWRGNIWFDGAPAWQEFDWVGQSIKLGEATARVDAPFQRCKSIMANTQTGQRDLDLLSTLNTFGHQNFGMGLTVIDGGAIRLGDTLELL